MISKLRIRALVNDSAGLKGLLSRHGLSLLVEARLDDSIASVLVDTGPTPEAIAHNVGAMGIDLRKVDAIFISHGHYDHIGGLLNSLKMIGKSIPVIVHPKAFDPKFVISPIIKAVGSSFGLSEIKTNGGIPVIASNPVRIADGITTSGEIVRETDFEKSEGFWTVENEKFVEDKLLDDQALILDFEKGLVIITGCAHSGIVNTIRHAEILTSKQEVYAIVGGFHLSKASEDRIAKTTLELMGRSPRLIAPCHCSGSRAILKFAKAFGKKCKTLRAGDVIDI
jgi:7,8-dihydropterin-6-yl-methyl-4-(beta-D-ribofuranosyl)aminobenzene 5'-phosphate synthase